MPAIPSSRLNFPGADPSKVAGFAWELDTDEVGAAVYLPGYPTRSVQVIGNDGGGSVLIEGALDPADPDWETIATITAEGIEALDVATPVVRASLTGGASGSVVVKLYATTVSEATITLAEA